MKIEDGRIVWLDQGTHRFDLDPFPYVMQQLQDRVPDLHELVSQSRACLFPDLINDRYRPGAKDALQLVSSKSHAAHGPLHSVGWDFMRLNHDIRGATRW